MCAPAELKLKSEESFTSGEIHSITYRYYGRPTDLTRSPLLVSTVSTVCKTDAVFLRKFNKYGCEHRTP
jgi:hypothetical protein